MLLLLLLYIYIYIPGFHMVSYAANASRAHLFQPLQAHVSTFVSAFIYRLMSVFQQNLFGDCSLLRGSGPYSLSLQPLQP